MSYEMSGHRSVNIHLWARGNKEPQISKKDIACEVPVSLVYNGNAHAVMMLSPIDLEDFAVGFSLTEGLVTSPSDITNIKVWQEDKGIMITIDIPEAYNKVLESRKRNLTGYTGCGICGIESLESALPELPKIESQLEISANAINQSYDHLYDLQNEKQATGTTHAAAFALPNGEIQIVREDVGRHNALDKLYGAMIKESIPPQDGFILITSRCSFEMVQKTVRMGCPILAAISSPTTLAIELAEQANLTLIAPTRKEQFNILTNPERISSC